MTDERLKRLLEWLDPDPKIAGQKYNEIRFVLTKRFARRGCHIPEELADRTMDRVMEKVFEVAPSYVGNPALYINKVGTYILFEYWKEVGKEQLALETFNHMENLRKEDEKEKKEGKEEKAARLKCLKECLAKLEAETRAFILSYYEGDKAAKAKPRKELRKKLADSLGVSTNVLRTRVQRAKAPLRKCIKDCLAGVR